MDFSRTIILGDKMIAVRLPLCVASVLLATPVLADEITVSVGPPLSARFDAAREQKENVYKLTVGTLTPAQQATLKAYQTQYLEPIQPEAHVVRLEFQMKFCSAQSGSAIARDAAKYKGELERVFQAASDQDVASLDVLRAKQ